MKYVFDLDGTLCTLTDGDYELAQPIQDRIDKVNALYEDGHEIIINTARGNSGKRELEEKMNIISLTYLQLDKWGLQYNVLDFNKPAGDAYIDDKGINADVYFID